MTAPHQPSLQNLQRFLLGTLPSDEAQPAVAWVENSPEAPRALAGIAAHDALTAAVASTVGVAPPPVAVVERIAQNATASFRAAAPMPDVSERTRATPASAPRRGSTADWPAPADGALRFGHFRVVRELGFGGMGVVYEAVDEKLGRRAAVKVLGEKWKADADARRRFDREARAIADLKSDHVVTVYQVGDEAGTPFMAMELIEGVTLAQWLETRPHPVTVEEVLWAARDLLTGLAAVHQKGRMHRDIKPANAMLVRDTGRLKILDFGLTRDADGSNQLTADQSVLGTASYMSPEQARGERLDARTDLFSVGVVLYRMVHGRSPFQRDTFFNTLHAVGYEPTPPPLTELPPALRGFVAKLMAPKREDRFDDAGAALLALKKVEAELAAPVARPAPVKPPTPWKTRVLLASVAVALLAAVVIIIRDKNGREVARIEVKEEAVKGGQIEVTDTTGNKAVVPVPPNKAEPQPNTGKAGPRESEKPPRPPEETGAGSRVRVTAYTAGYEDNTTDAKRLFVEIGTTGTITEFPAGKTRCRVRLDNPTKDEVWVLRDCLELN